MDNSTKKRVRRVNGTIFYLVLILIPKLNIYSANSLIATPTQLTQTHTTVIVLTRGLRKAMIR